MPEMAVIVQMSVSTGCPAFTLNQIEATLGELHLRCQAFCKARRYFIQDRGKTSSHSEQILLDQKLKKCE